MPTIDVDYWGGGISNFMLELLIIQVLLPDIYSDNYASELHIKFETDNFLRAPQIRQDNFIHKNVNKTK